MGTGEGRELLQLAEEAQRFLLSHSWCQAIRKGYLDRGWAGILAVFYFLMGGFAGGYLGSELGEAVGGLVQPRCGCP
jgi:hypothetical protein